MKKGVIIFLSSFVVQSTVLLFIFKGHHQPELYEYEEIAVNLLTKHSFVCQRLGGLYYSLVPPLYPLLCAVTYFLTNYSHFAMLLVQITLTALTCVIVYQIGKGIFNEKIGVISALACVFHPGLIIYSTMKLHELSLVTFMFSLVVLMILKFEKNMSYKNSVAVGMIFGLSILTRASIALFMPLFLIWLCRKNILNAKRHCLYQCALILVVTTVVILPWLIRNYMVHHQFVFMQTPSVDLWVGNNINATGTNYLKDGRTVFGSMPSDFTSRIYAADELTKDKIFREAVYEFIKTHPYRFAFLFFKKYYYFWWFSPEMGMKYPWPYSLSYKIWYSISLFFAIFGLVFVLSSMDYEIKKKAYIILILFLAISAAQSLFYVEGRHRWAIEPILLIFTANGIINLKNNIFIRFQRMKGC